MHIEHVVHPVLCRKSVQTLNNCTNTHAHCTKVYVLPYHVCMCVCMYLMYECVYTLYLLVWRGQCRICSRVQSYYLLVNKYV